MAGLSQSVDVSVGAALAKIGQLEAALKKATKATVEIKTQQAASSIRALQAALTKATASRTVTLNTASAQAKVDRLSVSLERALKNKSLTLDTAKASIQVDKLNKQLSAQQRQRLSSEKAVGQQIAASAASQGAARLQAEQAFAAREVQAKRISQAQIDNANREVSQFAIRQQQEQTAAAEKAASAQTAAATRAAREQEAIQNRAVAQQRQTLSAQLSRTRALQNFGQTLTFGLTLPLAAAGVSVAKLGFTFEDTINRIRILTTPAFRTSTQAVDQLRASILSLAGATGTTPTDLAEGFYQIASAGIAGTAAMDTLKASAQAAAIGLGTSATVADIITSALNAYGSSAGNAFQITNTLAEAVRIAKGEASDFAPVLGRLLPVAKNLGISFSDVAGSVALLTRNGLQASEATTQVRGLLNAFIKPSIQARQELDRVGLSSTQLLGQLQQGDFIGVLQRIRDAFGTDQLGLGRLFRNQQGLNAFLSLTRDLGSTATTLQQVGDAARKAATDVSGFNEIKSTPVFQFKAALADLQAQLLQIGVAIGPTVVSVARLAGGFLSFFNSLPSGVRVAAGFAAVLGAMAGPVLIVGTSIARLIIAQRQLALAQGEVAVSSGAESAALAGQGASAGRLATLLSGSTSILVKFGGALAAIASIGASFNLGQQLADASSGGQKFAAALGIAGTAATAFFAGTAIGGPILGTVAGAAAGAAGAIGFLGEQSKNAKAGLDKLRDSLVGVTDAAKQTEVLTKGGLLQALQGLLNNTDRFSQIELPDFRKAGITLTQYSAALVTGGGALKEFNKEAGSKIATQQFEDLQAALARGNRPLRDFTDSERGLIKTLGEAGVLLTSRDQFGNLSGRILDSAKAMNILRAAAQGDLTTLSDKLGVPIQQARDLTDLMGNVAGATTATGAAADDAAAGFDNFGNAAEGAATSVDDLIAGLDTAIKAAQDLDSVKLEAFTGQVDAAANAADLFDAIKKNKAVLPVLGQQFDLTTEKGRGFARQQKDVVDQFAQVFQGGRKSADALLGQTKSVDSAKFAYVGFFNQQKKVALAAGFTEHQFDLLAAQIGAEPTAVFKEWSAAGVDATSKVSGAFQTLLDSIPPSAAAAVESIKQPSDQMAALANQIGLLPDTKVTEIFAKVTNADTIANLGEVVQDLPPDKQVLVLAAVRGKPGVDALVEQIVANLPARKLALLVVATKGTPEAADLNAEIAKLPANVRTDVQAKVKGIIEARALDNVIKNMHPRILGVTANTAGLTQVQTLKRAIDLLHDKTVTVHAVTIGAGIFGAVKAGPGIARGAFYGRGGVKRYAAGGLERVPMIARARNGAGILWGEPETMGEAYIPFAQRHRQRAKHILARTAREFGMMVVPLQVPARRYATGGFTVDRNVGGGLVSDAALKRLVAQFASTRGRDAPLVGQVVASSNASDPDAAAVIIGAAVGRKVFEIVSRGP